MNVQLDNINAVSMLIVKIPMDLMHANANWAILEMEPHVTVRKPTLQCEYNRFDVRGVPWRG